MGGAMADRLLDAGYRVYGTSRTRGRAEALEDHGLRWLDTPRRVAEAVDVVLSSLPDDDAVNSVAAGTDGLLAGLSTGKIWIDLSTISPSTSREISARVVAYGALMLDAPVSGSVPQVQTGTLTIMVGGGERGYVRIEPVLRELGTPTHVGSNGQGLALKLAINISLAAQMIALAEGLLLAERSGVDRKLALDLMIRSPIGSPMLKARAPLILDLPKDAWFDLGLLQKDIELAIETGRTMQAVLPAASGADEVLTVARDLGYEHRDIAALYEVLRQVSVPKDT
jgi:3-hydroxyisobutyrate dehydrogenase-like beta-hydroxyacid dehydrogenase